MNRQMVGNLFVKELVWEPATGLLEGYRECATTPFGRYEAWYDGELWGPHLGRCLIGRHGTSEGAKAAAYEHLCNSIRGLVL